jgi:hypothetical protein
MTASFRCGRKTWITGKTTYLLTIKETPNVGFRRKVFINFGLKG